MNTITKMGIITVATVGTVAVLNADQKVDAATNYGTYTNTYRLNFRSGMGTNYSSKMVIPANSKFTLIMQYSNGWSKITYNGTTGYVSSKYISKSSSTNNNSKSYYKNYAIYKTTATLNLRSGMGTNYKSLLKIPYGASVKVYSNSNGWSKVTYNGTTGYVCSKYLTTNTSNSSNVNTNNKGGKILNTLIIVNKTNKTVSYYESGVRQAVFSCAIGKTSSPTPEGKFSIQEKIKNRPYYKNNIPGGDPRNPLGTRWLGIGGGYALHGTNNSQSIGGAVSGGCIRMYNNQVEWLYNKVNIGTCVLIGTGSNNNIALKYNIYIK